MAAISCLRTEGFVTSPGVNSIVATTKTYPTVSADHNPFFEVPAWDRCNERSGIHLTRL
jgi:hypothetical protein